MAETAWSGDLRFFCRWLRAWCFRACLISPARWLTLLRVRFTRLLKTISASPVAPWFKISDNDNNWVCRMSYAVAMDAVSNSTTVASVVFLPKRYSRRHRSWGVWCNRRVAIGSLLIKLAIISHGKTGCVLKVQFHCWENLREMSLIKLDQLISPHQRRKLLWTVSLTSIVIIRKYYTKVWSCQKQRRKTVTNNNSLGLVQKLTCHTFVSVSLNWIYGFQAPRLECIIKDYFFISQRKHMLWVPKRTVSMRRFFWAPKTYVQTDW